MSLEHKIRRISRELVFDPTVQKWTDGRTSLYRDHHSKSTHVIKPLLPGSLGGGRFCNKLDVRFPLMAGSMANGISSVRLVKSMLKHGFMASFGSAGLPLDQINSAIQEFKAGKFDEESGFPLCVNIIHSPAEPALEMACAKLLVDRGVGWVEASAYLKLTPAIVYYRVKGLRSNPSGNITTPRHIIAKVSRPEVARAFLSPPPERILRDLRSQELLSDDECRLARSVIMCDMLTVEADSGGHTDNRNPLTVFPAISSLVQRLNADVLLGLGGGIGTPQSVAAAFALGCDYVVTGSINQSSLEAGTSQKVKSLLAEQHEYDIMMAPAADMFEMGVDVQVVKRGSLFGPRANRLREIYRRCNSIEELQQQDVDFIEKTCLQEPIEVSLEESKKYLLARDPRQWSAAMDDPKKLLAVVIKRYLGLSSRWAKTANEKHSLDYQIWCGPAMGAFNEWVSGSFLSSPENRRVEEISANIMYNACAFMRGSQLTSVSALPMHLNNKEIIRPMSIAEWQQNIEG